MSYPTHRRAFDTALPGILTAMTVTGVIVWGSIIALIVWGVAG